ncbi:MAG: response regulator transcription factor [Sporolactobacillus sp.]|jgi:two-component system competent response regulator ComA|nr:response regulator transcription factor [Sporolactobacillus sp.]
MTSILVVDDHAVVASGTKVVLENAGFEVKALPDVRDLKAEVGARYYDLYLVDLNMPGMDGIEAADTIFQADPDAKVVIYTGYESEIEPLFSTMVTRGIAGIVSKSASVESLIAAVRAALRDEVLLPMWLFRKLDICGQSAVDSSENLHY